jgi:hypothetical protein
MSFNSEKPEQIVCDHDWSDWSTEDLGTPQIIFRVCIKCGSKEVKSERAELDVNELPTFDDPSERELKELISKNKSFVAYGLTDKLLETSQLIEQLVEDSGKSCRVLTLHTTTANIAGLLVGVGLYGFVCQAVHNIATMNPDFEVVRDTINHKIIVIYCDHFKPVTWW